MFFCVIQTPQSLIGLYKTLFSNLPLSNVCVLFPILIFSFNWPVSDITFSLPLCREGQHPGVASSLWTLRLAFCGICEASISQTRDSNILVLLPRCAPGPPTSLSILVRACLCCSLKGVVHTVVGNIQFLGNFSHGIAFSSQNKNRLSSLRRKFSFSGHYESISNPQMLMLQILNSFQLC